MYFRDIWTISQLTRSRIAKYMEFWTQKIENRRRSIKGYSVLFMHMVLFTYTVLITSTALFTYTVWWRGIDQWHDYTYWTNHVAVTDYVAVIDEDRNADVVLTDDVIHPIKTYRVTQSWASELFSSDSHDLLIVSINKRIP